MIKDMSLCRALAVAVVIAICQLDCPFLWCLLKWLYSNTDETAKLENSSLTDSRSLQTTIEASNVTKQSSITLKKSRQLLASSPDSHITGERERRSGKISGDSEREPGTN